MDEVLDLGSLDCCLFQYVTIHLIDLLSAWACAQKFYLNASNRFLYVSFKRPKFNYKPLNLKDAFATQVPQERVTTVTPCDTSLTMWHTSVCKQEHIGGAS